ncbi:ABC transporter substrate-binding protein [Leptothrix sp. BB-4]
MFLPCSLTFTKWFRHLCLALLAGGLTGWMADGASARQSTPPQVSVGVSRSVGVLPFHVAEQLGLFAAEGVRVTLKPCVDGLHCLADLFAGRTQLATVTELPVAVTSFQRDDFAVVATLGRSDRDIKILARRDARIASLDQLIGRRIALPTGTAAHYHLEVALMLAGIDPRSVIAVNLPPDRIPAAMASGEVDACVIWEPVAQAILRDDRRAAVALAGPRGLTHTFNLAASRNFIVQHDDTLVRVLRALQRAVDAIHEDPLMARTQLAQRLEVPADDIAARWADYDFRLKLPQSLVGTLERQIRWLRREGLVPAGPNPERPINVLNLLEPAPLRQAVPDAITLVK